MIEASVATDPDAFPDTRSFREMDKAGAWVLEEAARLKEAARLNGDQSVTLTYRMAFLPDPKE